MTRTVTEDVPVTGEVEGIIVLQVDYKTNSFAPTFVVSAINPQSGDYHMISSFVFEHVARVQEDEFIVDPAYEMARYYNYRGMFNNDYTLRQVDPPAAHEVSGHSITHVIIVLYRAEAVVIVLCVV